MDSDTLEQFFLPPSFQAALPAAGEKSRTLEMLWEVICKTIQEGGWIPSRKEENPDLSFQLREGADESNFLEPVATSGGGKWSRQGGDRGSWN